MPDDKELYLELMRATERSMHILIDAQRRCQEAVLDAPEPPVHLLRRSGGNPEQPGSPDGSQDGRASYPQNGPRKN